jgi:hypothetical protein
MDHTPSARYLALAAAAGAVGAYFLDPRQRRRRVARVRDRVVHLAHEASDLADAGARDLAHRARGVVAGLRQAVDRSTPRDDVLVQRVRSRLGRWVSYPAAIDVTAAAGAVTLSGAVLESEQERLLRELRWMHGVRRVQNRLQPQPASGDRSWAGGGTGRKHPRAGFTERNWSAGRRLLATTGGTGLVLYGLGRHSVGGTLLAIAGAALATRGATHRGLRRSLGVYGHPGAVEDADRTRMKQSIETGRRPSDAASPDGSAVAAPGAAAVGAEALS